MLRSECVPSDPKDIAGQSGGSTWPHHWLHVKRATHSDRLQIEKARVQSLHDDEAGRRRPLTAYYAFRPAVDTRLVYKSLKNFSVANWFLGPCYRERSYFSMKPKFAKFLSSFRLKFYLHYFQVTLSLIIKYGVHWTHRKHQNWNNTL